METLTKNLMSHSAELKGRLDKQYSDWDIKQMLLDACDQLDQMNSMLSLKVDQHPQR
jgi:hypothetical protein